MEGITRTKRGTRNEEGEKGRNEEEDVDGQQRRGEERERGSVAWKCLATTNYLFSILLIFFLP